MKRLGSLTWELSGEQLDKLAAAVRTREALSKQRSIAWQAYKRAQRANKNAARSEA